jgi:hypothetical protein
VDLTDTYRPYPDTRSLVTKLLPLLLIIGVAALSCSRRPANELPRRTPENLIPEDNSIPLPEPDQSLSASRSFGEDPSIPDHPFDEKNAYLLRTLLQETDTSSAMVGDSVYLQGGEVWVLSMPSQVPTQITATGGRMAKVFLSPTHKYAACLLLRGYVEEQGEYDDTSYVPIREEHIIVVVNVPRCKVIREFPYSAYEFDQWISNSRFVVADRGVFDLNGTYIYDAYRDSLREAPYAYSPNP